MSRYIDDGESGNPFSTQRAIKLFKQSVQDGQLLLEYYTECFGELTKMLKLMGSIFRFSDILYKRHKKIMTRLQTGKNAQHYFTAQDMFEFEKDQKKQPGSAVFREFHITAVLCVRILERYCQLERFNIKMTEPTMEVYMEVCYPIHSKLMNKAHMMAIKQLPMMDAYMKRVYPHISDSEELHKVARSEMAAAGQVAREITLVTEDLMIKYGFRDIIALLPGGKNHKERETVI